MNSIQNVKHSGEAPLLGKAFLNKNKDLHFYSLVNNPGHASGQ